MVWVPAAFQWEKYVIIRLNHRVIWSYLHTNNIVHIKASSLMAHMSENLYADQLEFDGINSAGQFMLSVSFL